MSLKTTIKRLERMSQQNKDIVIVTYLPDWNDPDFIIVSQAGKDNERISREEHKKRIAGARARGDQVYGIRE